MIVDARIRKIMIGMRSILSGLSFKILIFLLKRIITEKYGGFVRTNWDVLLDSRFGPQIGKPRQYIGRIGALGYSEGCRFVGQIDKVKGVLRISVDARGTVETSFTVVVLRLYY